MKKVIILASMLLMGQSSWAQIREFQTTRLNSTAGAGIASILSTEAAILNPATSAFFTGTSVSYHQYKTTLRNEADERDLNNDDFPSRNQSRGIFISDHDSAVKGGVAYIDQDENNMERSQVIGHGSAMVGDRTSLGFAYKYLYDGYPKNGKTAHSASHQLTAGTTHIVDDKTSVGFTIVDPTRTTPGEERIMGGFQFQLAEKLTLIGDVGTQYTQDVKEKYEWRAALQLQLFDDFFLRAGKSYDNIRENKGTGYGIGWLGPKLGVEFAQRFTEQFGDEGYVYKGESLVDTSLSAVIKF
jgi:hypothetical protein